MKLVYLAPVRWRSIRQRPHFMVNYLLAQGVEQVLWVEPYATRLPRPSDLWRRRGIDEQPEGDRADVQILPVRVLPLEPLAGADRVNRLLVWRRVLSRIYDFATPGPCLLGIGKPSSLAGLLAGAGCFDWTFYDAMDDFPAFYEGWSSRKMAQNEYALGRRVSEILVSSTALEQKFRPIARRLRLVRNACDAGIFPTEPLPTLSPVFGYIGTIANWFDWSMVRSLADAFPAAIVRLAGPCYRKAPAGLPANIELAGPCAHRDVSEHLAGFTVGLIPFRNNRLTRAVDPIKYYEYKAAGLPIISSACGDMAGRRGEDGVYIVADDAELATVAQSALAFRPVPESLETWRRANTWEARFSTAQLLAGMTRR